MLENILQLHQQNKKVLRADENMLFSESFKGKFENFYYKVILLSKFNDIIPFR